jgi:uncharacterized protein
VRIAGFAVAEANRLFGVPRLAGVTEMPLPLRPPMAVKADFLARHEGLMAACDGSGARGRDAGPERRARGR